MAVRRSGREIADELQRLGERSDQDRDRLELLHEVRVYQEELTVQNEELMHAQVELEATRDRFVELYDFAPNGYLTLDPHGVIRQINLTGSAMFGRSRLSLEGMPMLGFVDDADRTRFLDFMRRCRNVKSPLEVSASIKVRNADDPRIVQLICRPRLAAHKAVVEYLTAMIDVTDATRLEAERKRIAAERSALATRLISIQDDERQRIARDLHDNIGQRVTGIRLKLDAIVMAVDDDAARGRVAEAQQMVDQLDQQLDFIAAALRPAGLDVGICGAIEQFVREWSQTFGIAADFHFEGLERMRPLPEVETHLYRVAQEALNNVYKHASASHVSVVLERQDERLVLIVEDDGRGFDAEARTDQQGRGGLGLVGMRERAEIISGTLEIESTPGQGTTIFLQVPNAFVRQD
jgi:PAS domain S-box-containing protein